MKTNATLLFILRRILITSSCISDYSISAASDKIAAEKNHSHGNNLRTRYGFACCGKSERALKNVRGKYVQQLNIYNNFVCREFRTLTEKRVLSRTYFMILLL